MAAEDEQEFRSHDPLGRIFDPGMTNAEREEAKRRLAEQGQLDPEEHDEVAPSQRSSDPLNHVFNHLTGQKNSDSPEEE